MTAAATPPLNAAADRADRLDGSRPAIRSAIGSAIRVRGGATAEEIAAVVAALADRSAATDPPYERWRRGRIAALRGTSAGPDRGKLGH